MNVADEREEVIHVVNGLTFKPVLKEVTDTFIALVKIGSIADSDALDNAPDRLGLVSNEQMSMIGHQAVSVDNTPRRKWFSNFIFGVHLLIKNLNKLPVILTIEENVLAVNTAEHYMIDACKACFSRLS